jgi:hypothetical protein
VLADSSDIAFLGDNDLERLVPSTIFPLVRLVDVLEDVLDELDWEVGEGGHDERGESAGRRVERVRESGRSGGSARYDCRGCCTGLLAVPQRTGDVVRASEGQETKRRRFHLKRFTARLASLKNAQIADEGNKQASIYLGARLSFLLEP